MSWVYVIRLDGRTAPIDIEETDNFHDARQRAEQVAKYLGLPVRDQSSDNVVIREPDDLDKSIRQRAREEGVGIKPSVRPANAVSGYRVAGAKQIIDIPPMSLHGTELLAVSVGVIVIILTIIGFFYFWTTDPSAIVICSLYLVFLLPWILYSTIYKYRDAATRDRIIISSAGLILQRRYIVAKREWAIPTDRLEELRISAGIIEAISDRTYLAFGAGLGEDELRWLRDLLLAGLTAPGT